MTTFEGWMLGVTIAALLVSSVISIWSVVFGVRKSDFQILQAQLSAKAEELVDARFGQLAAEMKSPLAVLGEIVEQIKERLNWGEDKFVSDNERLHRVELACKQSSSETKAWALEYFATNSQLAGLSDELRRLQKALARCERACKHEDGE